MGPVRDTPLDDCGIKDSSNGEEMTDQDSTL
jgi:ubiquitin-protein ligase